MLGSTCSRSGGDCRDCRAHAVDSGDLGSRLDALCQGAANSDLSRAHAALAERIDFTQ